MTRTADNTAWAILAQHLYAEETMQVMHALTIQTMQAFPQWERVAFDTAKMVAPTVDEIGAAA